ncbi:MAG: hypothetical protein HC771_01385 [Synechococcales cyanobacterium CRU_2_2]|nr:hypothetical protein [Synechococcales cyanobacterium CRU_2_2]
MITFNRSIKAFRDYLVQGEVGDLALIKIQLLGLRPTPATAAQLVPFIDQFPRD